MDVDLPSLDITRNIRLDPPHHPVPVFVTAHHEVYAGLYTRTDPDTLQMVDTRVFVKQLIGTLNEQQNLEQRVRCEVAVWRDLQHPNVARFLGVAYIHLEGPPCLVSQYAHRTNLLEYIRRHPDSILSKAREIAHGLRYIHANGVVHGDVMADNVFVSDDGVAQINNFGMSRLMNARGFTTRLPHNIRFTAPELIPTSETDPNILPTYESDIFSLGILLLQLFNGSENDPQRRLPYNHIPTGHAFNFALLQRIHNGDRPRRERYTSMSDQHWQLLSQCWEGNPAARPHIQHILNVLQS